MRAVRFLLPAVVVVVSACGSTAPISSSEIPGADQAGTAGSTGAATTVAETTTTPPASVDGPATTTVEVPPEESTSTTSTTVATAPTTTALGPDPTTTVPAPEQTTTTAAPATTAPPLVYVAEPTEGTLRVGVQGPRSEELQQRLIFLSFLPAGADDGKYGPGTAGGVRRFQEDRGLVVDGVAGPVTLAALTQAVDEILASDIAPGDG